MISQSPARDEITTTRLPNGAVTEALVFPSFDRTVTDRPSPALLKVVETDPPLAVTLALTPPETADPLELAELITLHPPEAAAVILKFA